MHQSAIGVLCRDQEVTANFNGDFDGLRTFECIYELLPPAGSADRLVLDFSNVSQLKPVELFYLLAEMATEPRFSDMAISLENLQCSRMNKRS